MKSRSAIHTIMIDKRFLVLLWGLVVGTQLGLNAETSKKVGTPPHVVLLVIDDMGWRDLSCYGSTFYESPAIDNLANEGVRFTQAYASHPMCTGSRVGLMSGKFPSRLGVPPFYHGRPEKGGRSHSLELKEVTIAEALKEHGYSTFFAGKWHVGNKGGYPEDQGYDINIGGNSYGMPSSYFFPYGKRGIPGLADGQKGDYLTDRLTDRTIDFIKAQNRKGKGKPFFVHLSYYAVHTPLQGKANLIQKYRMKKEQMNHEGEAFVQLGPVAQQKMHQDNVPFAAMVEAVDQSVARIQKTLKELKLDRNTIIILTSDNGGDSCKSRTRNSTSNHPLKGGKCWTYEGGIRVPMIVKWPQAGLQGITSEALVSGVDHYPGILEMCGLPLKPEQHLDGVSYADAVRGTRKRARDPMIWNFPQVKQKFGKLIGQENSTVVRFGDYKLLHYYDVGEVELFNLREDLGETSDVSKEMPEKTDELLGISEKWNKEVLGLPQP